MAPRRRGRLVLWGVGMLLGLTVCCAAASWRQLAIHGLAWRAARDPALLVEYAESEEGSLKELAALHAAERWPTARDALLEHFLRLAIGAPDSTLGPTEPLAERVVELRLEMDSSMTSVHRDGDYSSHARSWEAATARVFERLCERLVDQRLTTAACPGMTLRVTRDDKRLVVRLESELLRPEPDALLRALVHASAGVRVYAAETLGGFVGYSDQAIPALAAALLDADDAVRAAAMHALLRRCASGEALMTPIGLLDESAAGLDTPALIVLARLGPRAHEAAPAVMSALGEGQRTTDFRQQACRTLGAIDPTGEVVLRSLIESTGYPESSVAATALTVLGDLGPAARGAADSILECLAAADPRVCRAAARALCRVVSGAEAVEYAVRVVPFLRHREPEALHAALHALDRLGTPPREALEPLLELHRGRLLLQKEVVHRLLERLGASPAEGASSAGDR